MFERKIWQDNTKGRRSYLPNLDPTSSTLTLLYSNCRCTDSGGRVERSRFSPRPVRRVSRSANQDAVRTRWLIRGRCDTIRRPTSMGPISHLSFQHQKLRCRGELLPRRRGRGRGCPVQEVLRMTPSKRGLTSLTLLKHHHGSELRIVEDGGRIRRYDNYDGAKMSFFRTRMILDRVEASWLKNRQG